MFVVFFCKQKSAYEIRLSDWSSDVCSSDLPYSAAATQRKKLSAPAWTASLQYQIDPDHMVYFNQRGSFRSGNLNGTVAPFIDPLTGNPANLFKNEKVHDFEFGYKFNGQLGDAQAQ